jgi:pyruvyl transferase EpsO
MLDNKNNTIDLSSPEKIRDSLQTALRNIGKFEKCALLDYPDYLNIGDHLIWLGTVIYLTDVLKTKISYAASIEDFSEELMEERVGQAPIFLQGGGNLGRSLAKTSRISREDYFKYRNQPIIILPQTIYFKNQDNLKRAAMSLTLILT